MRYLLSGIVLLLLTEVSYSQNTSTLITQVRIIDGTGIPAYQGSVRIKGNKIVAVGNLQALPGEQVISGQNKFLCPGFIDAHSHHFSSLRKFPQAAATNNQGITTIVIGQDGGSYSVDSLRSWMSQRKAAVNVATYTGHTTLREQVMGEDQLLRAGTPAEIARMQQLLAESLHHLFYLPGA